MTEANAELADLCSVPSAQQLGALGLGTAEAEGGVDAFLSRCDWSNGSTTLEIVIGTEPSSLDPLMAEHVDDGVQLDGAASAVVYEDNLYSDTPWAVTVLAQADDVFVEVEISGEPPVAVARDVAKEIAEDVLASI